MTRASQIVVVVTLSLVALAAFVPPVETEVTAPYGYVMTRGALLPNPPQIDMGRLVAEVIFLLAVGGIVLASVHGVPSKNVDADGRPRQ